MGSSRKIDIELNSRRRESEDAISDIPSRAVCQVRVVIFGWNWQRFITNGGCLGGRIWAGAFTVDGFAIEDRREMRIHFAGTSRRYWR